MRACSFFHPLPLADCYIIYEVKMCDVHFSAEMQHSTAARMLDPLRYSRALAVEERSLMDAEIKKRRRARKVQTATNPHFRNSSLFFTTVKVHVKVSRLFQTTGVFFIMLRKTSERLKGDREVLLDLETEGEAQTTDSYGNLQNGSFIPPRYLSAAAADGDMDGDNPIYMHSITTNFVLVWEIRLRKKRREKGKNIAPGVEREAVPTEESSRSERRTAQLAQWREKFVQNLESVGLLMEKAQPHLDLNTSAQVLSKLCVPNVMTESVPNRPLDYYTCAFRKSKMSRFLGCEDHETYFTNTQRHRVVYEILARTVYGKRKKAEVGVDRLLNEGAYTAAFPLHELQSYFAACEDETPAIQNHDRVLQRLCEHLDHALLYGLQDISSGYWVLVLHFTRKEAVRQIDELQHIATNIGRSRAWLYLALSESSLESYLRLFQENQALLQKYYFKNALVCSHDHLTLFLTLVSGLEFIRFDLELDVPYLDVAPYMPEYYKPQNVLDFEERLPSSDSLSLHSFTSLTSTNLEWDDSAIAPSSEEGDLTDQASCPRSSGSDPQTVISDTVVLSTTVKEKAATVSPHSPTFRHNPFNEDSDTNTSADVTPVHVPSRHNSTTTTTGDDTENNNNELEVIRMAKRRKPTKKRRGKSLTDSSSTIRNSVSSEQVEMESSILTLVDADSVNCSVVKLYDEGELRRSRLGSEVVDEGGEDGTGLRLPEMKDTSMDSVGQPLCDVIDQLNGALDREDTWEHPGEDKKSVCFYQSPEPPAQQPFRKDSGGKPPDPAPGETCGSPVAKSPDFLQASPVPADVCCFTPNSPDSASAGGSHHDSTEHSQSQTFPGGLEGEGEAKALAGQEPVMKEEEDAQTDKRTFKAEEAEQALQEEKLSPSESSHPAEFKVDNNHLLLLMIHVFRENEEQLFKMVRMSTGHMEGDLQPLYLLLTDCYIYLLRKGAAEKPYTVEDAVSYNELDYISVGLDQQTLTVVCTNRRRKFLLDTADTSLTCWFLSILKSAMVKGCREPPYPSVLTDATMEKLALTKFVSQESHCEVSEVSIKLYSLVHWEDPMDMTLSPHGGPPNLGGLSSTKEGSLQYRSGTTYLGKEQWKSCYLVLSNGILYLYAERTDVTPLLSVTMGGEHCGGCRRSNNTERPHAFQVILTERPPLVLCANNEQDMADWMQLLCQSVSKGVIPQGVAPTPCIPCCLVVTDKKLLTCHQDCQTSFFRSLGSADICDVIAVRLEADMEYCVIEFVADRAQFLPPWVLYFSGCKERDRLLQALDSAWKAIFQVELPHTDVSDPLVQKRCGEALELMKSAWQRADSLARGRAQREPWC